MRILAFAMIVVGVLAADARARQRWCLRGREVVRVHRVREPHIVTEPVQRFDECDRTQVIFFERVAFFVECFAQVGM